VVLRLIDVSHDLAALLLAMLFVLGLSLVVTVVWKISIHTGSRPRSAGKVGGVAPAAASV
jgi:hypothetical protein